MPVLPPDENETEDLVNSGMQLPRWLDARLKDIAAQRRKSRNWVMRHFLEWALTQYEQEEQARQVVEKSEPKRPKAK